MAVRKLYCDIGLRDAIALESHEHKVLRLLWSIYDVLFYVDAPRDSFQLPCSTRKTGTHAFAPVFLPLDDSF